MRHPEHKILARQWAQHYSGYLSNLIETDRFADVEDVKFNFSIQGSNL